MPWQNLGMMGRIAPLAGHMPAMLPLQGRVVRRERGSGPLLRQLPRVL